MADFRKPPGPIVKEQIERDVRARHSAFEPSDFPEPRAAPAPASQVEGPPERPEFLPWWRRVSTWFADAHRVVGIVATLCTATIAAHVWIKGLVTRAEVHEEVKQAVREAMVDVAADLAKMKDRTGDDFPPWRRRVDERLVDVEKAAAEGVKVGEKANKRIDDHYLAIARNGLR